MRRADRLFEIIQFMRQRPLTRARDLAERLEVSERTIYRDIADLMASGVPIEGEAGIGYVMRAGYDLPPLMFKEAEIEALVLGARIVQSWADKELAEAAGSVIAKVEAVIPEALRKFMTNTALLAPSLHYMEPIGFELADLRNALRDQLMLDIDYRDVHGDATSRQVRPLSLAYFGPVWVMAGWCELRQGFRTFRLDRITRFEVTGNRFPNEPGKTLKDFLARDDTWTRGRDGKHPTGSDPQH
jgi:predicted DNA-binding transcriptional regulator YafY